MFKKSNAGDQLLLAIKLNKVSEISRLVALGVNVNSRIDKNGKTALHYAAYKGLLTSVKALIEAGADLDITDENGVTALHRAVIDGHADVARALLDSGCSMDKKDENGNTPLHEAAWNGYSKCVTLLVNAKCNVNLHNREETNPGSSAESKDNSFPFLIFMGTLASPGKIYIAADKQIICSFEVSLIEAALAFLATYYVFMYNILSSWTGKFLFLYSKMHIALF